MAKFCGNCGKQLKNDNDTFCGYCGNPVGKNTPNTIPGQQMPINSTANAGSSGKITSNPATFIVIGVAVVGLIIVIACIALGSSHPAPSPSPATVTTAASSSSSSSAPSTPAPSFDSSASVDLNDTGKLHEVNLFLSNFTELGSTMNGYTYSGASTQQLYDFSIAHAVLNDPDDVKLGQGGVNSREIRFTDLSWYPHKFLKRELPNLVSSRGNNTTYSSFEGYVQFDSSQTVTTPQGIAYATSSKSLGNSETEVKFDIYYGGPYEATIDALYDCSLDELKSILGVSSPIASGTAVIEPHPDETSTAFKLISYESTR